MSSSKSKIETRLRSSLSPSTMRDRPGLLAWRVDTEDIRNQLEARFDEVWDARHSIEEITIIIPQNNGYLTVFGIPIKFEIEE